MTASPTCPDCEGTGLYGMTQAAVQAGQHLGLNIAICHCKGTTPRREGDAVDHPPHYGVVPGIECIDVVEHFSFNRGNAIKYLWRAGAKSNTIEDLRKAQWYIQREIDALTRLDAEAQPEQRTSFALPDHHQVGCTSLHCSGCYSPPPVPPTRPSPTTRGH